MILKGQFNPFFHLEESGRNTMRVEIDIDDIFLRGSLISVWHSWDDSGCDASVCVLIISYTTDTTDTTLTVSPFKGSPASPPAP